MQLELAKWNIYLLKSRMRRRRAGVDILVEYCTYLIDYWYDLWIYWKIYINIITWNSTENLNLKILPFKIAHKIHVQAPLNIYIWITLRIHAYTFIHISMSKYIIAHENGRNSFTPEFQLGTINILNKKPIFHLNCKMNKNFLSYTQFRKK